MAERKIILAVDDMPENLMLLGSLLEDYFDVRLAKSAKLAQGLLQDVQFDLILLDIEMPGMNGFEFLQMLKETETRNSHVPVMFVTSHADTEFIERAIKSGAKDYVLKPIKNDVLYKKIDTVIGMPKFKYNSPDGKLEQLMSALSSSDTARAKTLVTELTALAPKEGVRFQQAIAEVEKLIQDFDYKKSIDKIGELQYYRAVYKK